jgi:ATP-dependent Lhr-like helicase
VALHPADTVELTLRREPATDASRAVHDAIAAALATGAGFFARQLGDAVRAGLAPVTITDDEIARAVWDLVWEGRVSGDTRSPLRSRLGGGRTAHRRRATPARGRYSRRATGAALAAASRARVGGDLGGRWFALPEPATGTTQIAAGVEVLLDRYGVLTRGSVTAESFPGGFAAAYRVLVAMEEAGRVRRGYFVEGLGASQFATSAAVDRLRGGAAPVAGAGSEGWQPSGSTAGASAPGIKGEPGHVVVLAACDPANPFGASLAWPATEGTHRPARRAGALVVLAGPDLVVYAERGARTMLTFTSDPSLLAEAARALAATVRTGALSALTVTSVDGHPLLGSDHPWVAALVAAGFHATPRGLRLRR